MGTIRNLINEEFSGARALEHTEKITRYYRSPGSSGIQTVTKFCADQLKSAGIDDVVIENFPMDGTAVFLGRKVYPAWEPKEVVYYYSTDANYTEFKHSLPFVSLFR